jgi:long-chain fatty acid transport protein
MKNIRINKKLIASAIIVIANNSMATDVLRLSGYGPVSRSMGGTGVAHYIGPAGMMVNPATLSMANSGYTLSAGLDIITADITNESKEDGRKAITVDHSQNRGPYFAPEFGFIHQKDKLTLGTGVYALGGLGTEYGTDSFLSDDVNGNPTGLDNSSRLLIINIPFAASYEITDTFSVGGSIDAIWAGINLNLLLTTAQIGGLESMGNVGGSLVEPLLGMSPTAAHISFTENNIIDSGASSWGIGGRIGAIWQPQNETMLGISYNFPSKLNDLSGDANLTAVTSGSNMLISGKIEVKDFQMPGVLTIGLSHNISDYWLVAVDVSRVYWSPVMKDLDTKFTSAAGNLDLALPQNYKNQSIFGIGTSYQMNKLTIRAGYRSATSGIDGDFMFSTLPVNPTRHISAGFGYQLSDNSNFDLSYTHAVNEKTHNDQILNTPVPIVNNHSQDNLSFTYSINF